MALAEYARHRGKIPQYISKLLKAGILVMRGRLVDVAASDAVLDNKPSEEILRRLEFDTRQGKLVEAAVVKERWAAILVVIK